MKKIDRIREDIFRAGSEYRAGRITSDEHRALVTGLVVRLERESEVQVVETIWAAYYAAATSESNRVASSRGMTYTAMRRAFLASVREVYELSPLKAQRVYDVLLDGGGTVQDAVIYVRTHRTSSAYEH